MGEVEVLIFFLLKRRGIFGHGSKNTCKRHKENEQGMRRDSWNKLQLKTVTAWDRINKFGLCYATPSSWIFLKNYKLVQFLFFILRHYLIATKLEKKRDGKVIAGHLYFWLDLLLEEKCSFSWRLLWIHAQVWLAVWVKIH